MSPLALRTFWFMGGPLALTLGAIGAALPFLKDTIMKALVACVRAFSLTLPALAALTQ